MNQDKKDALQIAVFSALAFVVYLILPDPNPAQYKGLAKDLIPFVNFYLLLLSAMGILVAAKYFFKK